MSGTRVDLLQSLETVAALDSLPLPDHAPAIEAEAVAIDYQVTAAFFIRLYLAHRLSLAHISSWSCALLSYLLAYFCHTSSETFNED